MFYFTCNESKIYESFTFWNKLQEKMNFSRHSNLLRCTCIQTVWCLLYKKTESTFLECSILIGWLYVVCWSLVHWIARENLLQNCLYEDLHRNVSARVWGPMNTSMEEIAAGFACVCVCVCVCVCGLWKWIFERFHEFWGQSKLDVIVHTFALAVIFGSRFTHSKYQVKKSTLVGRFTY